MSISIEGIKYSLVSYYLPEVREPVGVPTPSSHATFQRTFSPGSCVAQVNFPSSAAFLSVTRFWTASSLVMTSRRSQATTASVSQCTSSSLSRSRLILIFAVDLSQTIPWYTNAKTLLLVPRTSTTKILLSPCSPSRCHYHRLRTAGQPHRLTAPPGSLRPPCHAWQSNFGCIALSEPASTRTGVRTTFGPRVENSSHRRAGNPTLNCLCRVWTTLPRRAPLLTATTSRRYLCRCSHLQRSKPSSHASRLSTRRTGRSVSTTISSQPTDSSIGR